MNSITQDMKYRQSLLTYAQKYGVSRTSRKYNKSRSYIYFWLARYDGSLQSLACQSRRPHSHPRQHTQEELMCRREPSSRPARRQRHGRPVQSERFDILPVAERPFGSP